MEGVRHAMLQVIAQRLLLDLVERGAHGADLRQHVDAVTPRTWPSIRLRRASCDFLSFSSILEPYPRRV